MNESIKILINNKLDDLYFFGYQIYYTEVIDDVKEHKQTAKSNFFNKKKYSCNYIKDGKEVLNIDIYIYIVEHTSDGGNRCWRYEFFIKEAIDNLNIALTKGQKRPIVRINDKPTDSVEFGNFYLSCRGNNLGREKEVAETLDDDIYYRKHPIKDDGFCIIC